MPPVDSRLGPGTLAFGTSPTYADDYSLQVASCSLMPTVNETDGTPTLADTTPAAEMTVTWTIGGNTISDWSDDGGFVNWAMDNSGTETDFKFYPSTADGIYWTGTCQVRPIEIGGDVMAQSSVAFEFPLTGDPTRVLD